MGISSTTGDRTTRSRVGCNSDRIAIGLELGDIITFVSLCSIETIGGVCGYLNICFGPFLENRARIRGSCQRNQGISVVGSTACHRAACGRIGGDVDHNMVIQEIHHERGPNRS